MITVKFGTSSFTTEDAAVRTVADIVRNPAIKGALGFGDNVAVYKGSSEVSLGEPLYGNETLVLATKAASKQVR